MKIDNQWWQHLMLDLTILTIILSDSIESRVLANTATKRDEPINEERDSELLLPIRLNDNINNRNKQDKVLFNCETDGYFPDPQDRSKYHICNSGIDTVVSCPDGAIWDTVRRSCFYINMVSCEKDVYQVYETKSTRKTTRFMLNKTTAKLHVDKTSTISNPPSIDSSNITSEHHTHSIFSNREKEHDQFSSMKIHTKNEDKNLNTTSANVQMNISDPLFKCPSGIEEYRYISDPYDCSLYHLCAKWFHATLHCTRGFFYDPTSTYCDWPERVLECKPTCPSDGRRMRISSSKGSNYYNDCIDGQMKEQICPTNQYYSTEFKQCQ